MLVAHSQDTTQCPQCPHGMNWHTQQHGCTHADDNADTMWATCSCPRTPHEPSTGTGSHRAQETA